MSSIESMDDDYILSLLNDGVVNITIDVSGNLILTLRNSTVINTGQVVDLAALNARLVALEPDAGDGVWMYVGGGGAQPPFGSGISNFGAAWQPVRFRRDKKVVRLDGLAKITLTTSPQTVFTLPSGFRPTKGRIVLNTNVNSKSSTENGVVPTHTQDLGGVGARVDVLTNGQVVAFAPNLFITNSHLSFGGLIFRTD